MIRNTAFTGLLVLLAAAARPQPRDDKAPVLTFESSEVDELKGWRGGPRETLFIDDRVFHSGAHAGRLERASGRSDEFSSFTLSLPIDFGGEKLELRGWLKLEDVSGQAGLWQRQDGPSGPLEFDNMNGRPLRGTSDWTEYSVVLRLNPSARTVVFGALLIGAGRVWVDDLKLLVDGRPLADAPAKVTPKTALDIDREFDAGSKVTLATLTPAQVDNLALLGKVWGFLKYHHPAVVRGDRHWDYDLFRVLPKVLSAADRPAAQAALRSWIRDLGPIAACEPCAKAPEDGAPLLPRLEWLSRDALVGADLGADLRRIHADRPAVDEQFYVAFRPGVRNPDFKNEAAYIGKDAPDAGYRLLALFRFWNIIEYWFPYRDVMQEDWDGVLREFVPRVAAAASRDDYDLAIAALVARIHDGHANVYTPARPPRGDCMLPFTVRFVEDQPVVTGYLHPGLGPATGAQVGDAIRTIDGEPIDRLLESWRPYYGVSNEASYRRTAETGLTRGTCGPVALKLVRKGEDVAVNAARAKVAELDIKGSRFHDQPGETFHRLSDDLAYLKLSTAQNTDAAEYVRRAAGARCLVLDIRNYPEFVVFGLGQHLVSEKTTFALFTAADPANPGSFRWTDPVALVPAAPRFEGRIVILVDEVSMSRAEYVALAFRSVPGALVVGSTTAGPTATIRRSPCRAACARASAASASSIPTNVRPSGSESSPTWSRARRSPAFARARTRCSRPE